MSGNMIIFGFGFVLGCFTVILLLGLILLVKGATKNPGVQSTLKEPFHSNSKVPLRENGEVLFCNFLLYNVTPFEKVQVADRGQAYLLPPSHTSASNQ